MNPSKIRPADSGGIRFESSAAYTRCAVEGSNKVETNLEQCPLCGSELSQTKFREIRAKLRNQEEKKATELAEAKLAVARDLEEEFKKRSEQQIGRASCRERVNILVVAV